MVSKLKQSQMFGRLNYEISHTSSSNIYCKKASFQANQKFDNVSKNHLQSYIQISAKTWYSKHDIALCRDSSYMMKLSSRICVVRPKSLFRNMNWNSKKVPKTEKTPKTNSISKSPPKPPPTISSSQPPPTSSPSPPTSPSSTPSTPSLVDRPPRQSPLPVPVSQPSFPNSASNSLPGNMLSDTKFFQPTPKISIVVAVLNEIKSLPLLVESVAQVMQADGLSYEIVAVDDGSSDGSSQLLQAMAAERQDLTAVILRRNFGQTAALAAGFENAAGELIVTMDADLQNDPSDIPMMVSRLEKEGVDVMCGWRRRRQDPGLRTLPSRAANALIRKVTQVNIHDTGCTLKVWKASLAKILKPIGETHRFLPAIAAMEGATISEVEVTHHPRAHGSSHYSSLGRVPRVLLDLLTLTLLKNFRDRPMHLFGGLAGASMVVAAAAAVAALGTVFQWLPWVGISGAMSQAAGALVLTLEMTVAALHFFGLGLIADLQARTFFEARRSPVYRIRNIVSSNRTSRIKDRFGKRF